MASIAAFVYFWSSAYEVSGGCATDTLKPSFLRMSATLFQPEPSAKAPCTRTTFLICCVMTNLLCVRDPLGSVDFRSGTPSCQTALLSCRTYWAVMLESLELATTIVRNEHDTI